MVNKDDLLTFIIFNGNAACEKEIKIILTQNFIVNCSQQAISPLVKVINNNINISIKQQINKTCDRPQEIR